MKAPRGPGVSVYYITKLGKVSFESTGHHFSMMCQDFI